MPYQLEQITSKHSPIYRQLYNYYHFCERLRQMSPATICSKVYILNDFVRSTRLKDLRKITNQHINDWVNLQSIRNNSGRSINDRLAHLRAMLRWQKEMNLAMPKLQLGLIPRVKEVPARKVCFSRTQIQSVLKQASLEEWLLIRLAFDCGLRISELRNLCLSDIYNNRLTIVGKGCKRRYAYLSPDVQRRLRVWVRHHQIQNHLWPSPLIQNQPIAVCTLRQKMRSAFQRAGLNNFCPHDLRHSYATDLKLLGVPTRIIQASLGHASESVTERYLSDLDGLDLWNVYQQKYAKYSENVEN